MTVAWAWLARHFAPIAFAFLAGVVWQSGRSDVARLRADKEALIASDAAATTLAVQLQARIVEMQQDAEIKNVRRVQDETELERRLADAPVQTGRCDLSNRDRERLRIRADALNDYALGDLRSATSAGKNTKTGATRVNP